MKKQKEITERERKTNDPLDALRKAPTSYKIERDDFIDYLAEEELAVGEQGIEQYLVDCEGRTRGDREGNEVSFSASWFNQRVKAIKETVRYALDHTGLPNGRRYAVEKYLQGVKTRKPKAGISKAERVPTAGEVATLIDRAGRRLAFMIRFLVETGCRISEMIGAEIGNARRGERLTRVEITGKGGA